MNTPNDPDVAYVARTISPLPPQSGKASAVIYWAVFAIILAALVYRGLAGGPSASRTNGDESGACIVAEKLVTQNLKAPATAAFPDACSASQSGRTWTVASYVDSQNGFGALIRTSFVIKMEYQPSKDNYRLLDLRFID